MVLCRACHAQSGLFNQFWFAALKKNPKPTYLFFTQIRLPSEFRGAPFGDRFVGKFLSSSRNEFFRQRMFIGKFMDSHFESRMESVADVPLIEFDSHRSGKRPSAKNPVGYEEAKLTCFHAVMVVAEPLDDFLLRDGIVAYVVTLQGTGTIVVFKTADRLWIPFFFHDSMLLPVRFPLQLALARHLKHFSQSSIFLTDLIEASGCGIESCRARPRSG